MSKDHSEMRLVVAVVANMKTVRLPFYGLLAAELEKRRITLRVIFSDPYTRERDRNDTADLPPPIGVKVRALHALGGHALIQLPPAALLAKADLIIVVQANSYLLNYPLLLLNSLSLKRVAFWGHAFNHQGQHNALREKFKRSLATKVTWWFTYTQPTKTYLAGLGFPNERITVIQNAIDTRALSNAVATYRDAGVDAFRQSVAGSADAFVALCCGSLYPEKQLPFLIKTGDVLSARFPNFRLIMIGDGPQRELVQDAALSRPWLKYMGPQFGEDKIKLFAISDIFLNPGLVGLAILDSFAAGLPFITSDYVGHSPEIAYLEHHKNGLVLPFEANAYANGVAEIISNPHLLAKLRAGALASASTVTLENMVSNVANGISDCLLASSPMAEHPR